MHTKSLNANEMIQLNAMPCNHEAVNGTDFVFISHCSSLQSTQTALTVNETLARWPFGDSRDQVICEGAEPPRDPVWSSGDTFQPAR